MAVDSEVGKLVGDGDGMVGGAVEVSWGAASQYRRSKSPFERERDGSPLKRIGPTGPSGQV